MPNIINHYCFLNAYLCPSKLSEIRPDDRRLVAATLGIEAIRQRLLGPCKYLSSSKDCPSERVFVDFLEYAYDRSWPLDWRLHLYFIKYLHNINKCIKTKFLYELCSASASQWTYWSKSPFNYLMVRHSELNRVILASKAIKPNGFRKIVLTTSCRLIGKNMNSILYSERIERSFESLMEKNFTLLE